MAKKTKVKKLRGKAASAEAALLVEERIYGSRKKRVDTRKRAASGGWVNDEDPRYKKWRATGKYIRVGEEKKRKLLLKDQNGSGGRKSYNSHEEAKDRGWRKA